MADEKKPAYVVKEYGRLYGVYRTAAYQVYGFPAHTTNTPLCTGGYDQMKDQAENLNRRNEIYRRRQQANRPEVRG